MRPADDKEDDEIKAEDLAATNESMTVFRRRVQKEEMEHTEDYYKMSGKVTNGVPMHLSVAVETKRTATQREKDEAEAVHEAQKAALAWLGVSYSS